MRVGLPTEAPEWAALAAALLLVVLGRRRWPRRLSLVALAALAACLLSAAYVALYLRGGPRIIDATSYFLEARTFAAGRFTFDLGEPAASTMGRFLVRPHGDASVATPIFPPGYPALLALGVLAGAPLAVGPLLAAALVAATWCLARRVSDDPLVARAAAALSVVCAALRYHTADTMSHGLAALCFSSALAFAFGASDAARAGRSRRAAILAALAGLAAGWLLATRPASALALGATGLATTFFVGVPARSTRHLFAFAALGATPGVALLLLHQHAATGLWLSSSQKLYYALADGPAGCFAYGFGANVGCVGEHGDFVRARLEPNGYGLFAAMGTTGRRLLLHTSDAGNAEPLFLLVLVGGFVAWKTRGRARALVLAVVAQVLAYAPFYFDGNYPGGGARFYADVLPLEHVLMGLAIAAFARRAESQPARKTRATLPVALALLGFAVRGGYEHAALRDREGGRPMFDREVLARAGVEHGLVFVSTDHGFNLGFDPSHRSGFEVARWRGDGLDDLLWREWDSPPAFFYSYDVATGRAAVERLRFDESRGEGELRPNHGTGISIDGGSLWPAVAQHGAYALSEAGCATPSNGNANAKGRWLAVRSDSRAGWVVLELPQALSGTVVAPYFSEGSGRALLEVDGNRIKQWFIAPHEGNAEGAVVPASGHSLRLFIFPAEGETLALVRVEATRAKND